MKTKLFGLVAALMMFGAMPGQASTLVDHGTYTTDTATGLQWLDLTLTPNISYNDMLTNLANPSYTYYGYRYATTAEVSTLIADAGLTEGNTLLNSETPSLEALIALLGVTLPDGAATTASIGLTSSPVVSGFGCSEGSNPACVWAMELAIFQLTEEQKIYSASLPFPVNYTSTAPGHGSLLVRVEPTPLPAALPLFASGLGALGLLGWKRKRKAAALAA